MVHLTPSHFFKPGGISLPANHERIINFNTPLKDSSAESWSNGEEVPPAGNKRDDGVIYYRLRAAALCDHVASIPPEGELWTHSASQDKMLNWDVVKQIKCAAITEWLIASGRWVGCVRLGRD